MAGGRNLANRIVDVRTERLPALIAVEERRKDARRQSRRGEERIASERVQDHRADLLCDGVVQCAI